MKQFEHFIDTISTKYQRERAFYALDSVIEELYSTKPLTDIIAKHCTAHQKEVLLELLNAGNIPDKLAKEILELLKAELASIPILTMEVAVEPSDALVKRIAGKLELILKKKIIVDFRQKRSIMGGAIIQYGGKYGDFTLKNI